MSITQSYFLVGHDLSMPKKPPSPEFKEFAARFEALRVEAKLPKEQLALGKKLGVSGAFINQVRHGQKMLSMDTAIRWARVLGVCVEYLLTGRGPKYPENNKKKAPARVTVDITDLSPEHQRAARDLVRALGPGMGSDTHQVA